MKKILILALFGAIVTAVVLLPQIMLSPGELVHGHENIRDKCTACHKPFSGVESQRCTSCHKLSEIGKDSAVAGGPLRPGVSNLFHSRLGDVACTSCHTDHKGINPMLPVSRFDHSILTAEQKTDCAGCHGMRDDDLHHRLSSSCSACHNTSLWNVTEKFDHSMILRAAFDCASCHERPRDSFHNLISDSCGKCHSTTAWKPSTFNHSAYFILDRDHNAECTTCHTQADFSGYTCYGCHEHSAGKVAEEHHEHGIYNFTDCASCHRSGDEHDIRNSPQDFKQQKDYIKSKGKKEHDGDD